jgi:hypothetical protein
MPDRYRIVEYTNHRNRVIVCEGDLEHCEEDLWARYYAALRTHLRDTYQPRPVWKNWKGFDLPSIPGHSVKSVYIEPIRD